MLLQSGLEALLEYLSAHVLTCLVPAFFIAGAIAVFVSKDAVLKYFGARANKILSYGVASVSGAILAVCSCTILPLFAGIRQRGAGLGPAVAFLYSGPAINVLAVVYSARLLGLDIGIARGVGAIAFSVVIGLMMAFFFHRSEQKMRSEHEELILPAEQRRHPLWQVATYFAVMVGLLVSASAIGLVIQTLGKSNRQIGSDSHRKMDGRNNRTRLPRSDNLHGHKMVFALRSGRLDEGDLVAC